MFTKTAFALAILLGAASATLAATKQHSTARNHDAYDTGGRYDVYDPRGRYMGSDPDANVRFELRRDWQRGQQ